MKSGATHTSFKQGTKIIIHFIDGTKRIDKYIEKKRGVIITRKLGRISLRKIRSIGIFKNYAT